jgi:hypothetical protein
MFWVPVIGIWSFAVAKLDSSEVLNVMAGTAAINASVGGLYGRLMNKWRETLKYEEHQ